MCLLVFLFVLLEAEVLLFVYPQDLGSSIFITSGELEVRQIVGYDATLKLV